ncbi:Protein of uncharacterised function (DUF692) [Bordetella ansorpii]|uniref:UPF0276 protein SAMEA3906486_01410 n=1 Tax=Bordetella ansorpii TaxID=288768 RepID=A0A157S9Z4_9BORD|nr:DUF692 domain-containing protein [Bordetella ansorpii]SAI67260.1 Protein of uncharacterised function (DUF692) [Bordetella ansorpii]
MTAPACIPASQDGLPLAQGQPRALAGAGFKHQHVSDIRAAGPAVDFFEVHAENYMGAGGPAHLMLATLRQAYPISVHGVGMSIGGTGPLDVAHLARLRDVVRRYEPFLVSEHLAWSSHDGAFFNDLLPVPYTDAMVDAVCGHLDQVQDVLQRQILLENPATYVEFASSTLQETEFLLAVARRTGCGLLLDVNNVFVSAANHGYSPLAYLDAFPMAHVQEIHLAGHRADRDGDATPLLIDSHDCAVAEPVWQLYRYAIGLAGPRPTLVEWDSALPAWSVLRDQAAAARRIMTQAGAGTTTQAAYA